MFFFLFFLSVFFFFFFFFSKVFFFLKYYIFLFVLLCFVLLFFCFSIESLWQMGMVYADIEWYSYCLAQASFSQTSLSGKRFYLKISVLKKNICDVIKVTSEKFEFDQGDVGLGRLGGPWLCTTARPAKFFFSCGLEEGVGFGAFYWLFCCFGCFSGCLLFCWLFGFWLVEQKIGF